MASFAVVVDVSDIERVAQNLLMIDNEGLGRASLRAVNEVAERGLNTSIRTMLSGVNLTEAYVRERMDVEPANDPASPTATIVAFRPGGERRPNTRPVNLRQFAVLQEVEPVRWQNDDPRIRFGLWGMNPRKAGSRLPWIKRTGAPHLGIPVGMKQAGISVEVVKGQRKTLPNAFLAAANAGKVRGGQGLLVFSRAKGQQKKTPIKSLSSLSVWQMFRHTAAKVIPLIAEDLQTTVGDEVVADINKMLETK